MQQVFSFGCGRQSVAALVLAARGLLDVDAFVFANVGEDSENPATLRYFRKVALPYAREKGLKLIELRKTMKDGRPETILGRLLTQESSLPIPVRMSGNHAPGHRGCTTDFKVRLIARWLKDQGATVDNPATVHLGISADEWRRMRSDSGIAWQKLAYPLVDRGMTVEQCLELAADEGLPLPPRSSCWFCPMKQVGEWRRMRDEEPGLFWMAAGLELLLNDRRRRMGKDPVWFSYYCKPLGVAFAEPAPEPDEEPACESGYCMV